MSDRDNLWMHLHFLSVLSLETLKDREEERQVHGHEVHVFQDALFTSQF